MEAKILPDDVCIFNCFRRLPLAAAHSANCQFDSGVKWWINVSSIVTYLCKNSFLLHWNSCKQRSESSMRCCFWTTDQTWHPLWTQLSHWQMFLQNGEYTAFWYLQLLCYLMKLIFTISQNEFVEFFGVFWDNCRIWVTWAFSIICVCTAALKVSIPPLNSCFRQSRVQITLIKPLLCLNSIFPYQKAMLDKHTKFRFFHCFGNLQQ